MAHKRSANLEVRTSATAHTQTVNGKRNKRSWVHDTLYDISLQR